MSGDVHITLEHGNEDLLRALICAIPKGTSYWIDCEDKRRGRVTQGARGFKERNGDQLDCDPAPDSRAPDYITLDEVRSITVPTPVDIARAELYERAAQQDEVAEAAARLAEQLRQRAAAL